jgi:acyl-coenzyme A thioesterase PaaI-like protein
VHPDGPRFGLRTGERHLNNRGAVHGGVLSPIADTTFGYSLTYGSDEPVVLTTAQLSIDLPAGIGPDEWLDGQPGPGRLGGRLAFGYGQFTLADTVVAVVRDDAGDGARGQAARAADLAWEEGVDTLLIATVFRSPGWAGWSVRALVQPGQRCGEARARPGRVPPGRGSAASDPASSSSWWTSRVEEDSHDGGSTGRPVL